MLPQFAVDLTKTPRPITILRAVSRQYLSLCLLCSTTAQAQYRFDHWTADNGLPQNSVRDIVQTQDGYLWFTTFHGLVRFDGVRFTVFNKSNSPGLPSNRFVSLFEDRAGDLWATLETGEVVRRHQGRFTTYTLKQLSVGQQFPMLDDDGQGNAAIYYLQFGNDEQLKALTNIVVEAHRWSGDRFQPAKELSLTFSGMPVSAQDTNGFYSCRLVEGDLWLTGSERLFRFRKGGGTQVYSQQNGSPGTQPRLIWSKGRPLEMVSRDTAGRLWLTDLKSMQSQVLSPQTPEGFEVVSGYADNEGNYWFGSYNNGLYRARRQTATPYAKAQGLDVKEVYPLLEGRDGSLWVGTYGRGLFRFKDGAFTQYTAPKMSSYNDFSQFAHSLYEDRAGQLRVNGGWRLEGGHFVREAWTDVLFYPTPKPAPNVVWTMCEDRASAFWFGTSVGVFRYRKGTVTHFTTK